MIQGGGGGGRAQEACDPFPLSPKYMNKLANIKKIKKKFHNLKKGKKRSVVATTNQPDKANFTRASAGSGVTGVVKYSIFNEWKPQESLQIRERVISNSLTLYQTL